MCDIWFSLEEVAFLEAPLSQLFLGDCQGLVT